MSVFFFSDIEGSTKLWEEYPDTMGVVLTRHDEILRTRIEKYGGVIVKHTGDGVFAIFEDGEPLRGAIEIQKGIYEEDWSELKRDIRIRIALHSGAAEMRGNDYFGADVNKAARLLTVGWGGQILLTDEVLSFCELPDRAEIIDHYAHILKDLSEPIRVYGLTHPDLQLTEFPSLRSLSAHPNNLPLQSTQFIGRKTEIEAISLLVDKPGCRILTLVGPGGIGKTRLALQVAAERVNGYADGVFFVPLESLESFEYVVQSIADSLNFNFHDRLDKMEQLLDFLKEKELLLVIDNFEHVIDASALIVEISQASPAVTMLLTSREVLNLHGEWLFEVQGLPVVPEVRNGATGDGEDAVTLFIESARRIKPDFDISDEDLSEIIDICRAVEGMPLGIELAASWVRLRSLSEIADDVRDGSSFLYSRSRDVPERHRSIKAVFEYSWNLLSKKDRKVFRGLSVFNGGFSLEAAREIVGTSIHDISGLVEKSIIRKTPQGRFDFHPVLKEFVIAKLDEAGDEKGKIESLHSAYFAGFMSERESELHGENQMRAIEEIDMEIENVRVGWKMAVEDADSELIGKYLDSLFVYHNIKGWYSDGAKAFGKAAEVLQVDKAIVYAALLSRRAVFESHLGNPGEARKLCMESLFVSQEFDDDKERAFSLRTLSNIYFSKGEYPDAKRYSEAAEDIYREIRYDWGIASCLNGMGRITRAEGEIERAREYYLESLAMWDKIGDIRASTVPLNNLGTVSRFLGEYEKANEYFQRCLSIARDIGNPRLIAVALLNIGNIGKEKSDFVEADLLYRESFGYMENIGDIQLKALCLSNMGAVACGLGSYREAEELCLGSLETKRKLGNNAGIASSLNTLGEISIGLSKYEEAREYLLEALQVAFDINRLSLCLEVLKNVSRFFDAKGKSDLSLLILAYIIENPASSFVIKSEAVGIAKSIKSDLSDQMSEEKIEKIEADGREMNLDEMVEQVLARLR